MSDDNPKPSRHDAQRVAHSFAREDIASLDRYERGCATGSIGARRDYL